MNPPEATYANAFYGLEEAERPSGYLLEGPTESRIRNLLLRRDSNLRERIERAVRQWNPVIREQLRNETGLRFTLEKKTLQIPVTIVDGLPLPLEPVMAKVEEWILELLRHKRSIRPAVELLDSLAKRWGNISAHLTQKNLPPSASLEELGRARKLLTDLQNNLPILEVAKKTREINTDVLGAYFFRKPRVEVYWMAIAIYAELIGASVEGLAAAVLIHELAHAYTHVGYDIDGQQWETQSFGKANLCIIEGLAQFYTCVISERLSERLPEAHQGYVRFLKLQSGPYRAHLLWANHLGDVCEVVRGAMLEARCHRITDDARFLSLLDQYHKQLKGFARPVVKPPQGELELE